MTIITLPEIFPVPHPNRRLFTRKDCEDMERIGILSLPYELIEGEIIEEMPYNRPHAYTLMELTTRLIQLFGAEFVQSQMPIEIVGEDAVRNFPIPDLVLLRKSFRTLPDTHPLASDIRLLVEVSDSTLPTDITAKARLFARAGIEIYWIVDVKERRLFVLTEPKNGDYSIRTEYTESESITLEEGLETLTIASLFPQ